MIERTLILVKPDGVYRALTGKVVSTMEDAGLKVIALKMVWPTKEIIEKHYAITDEWIKSTAANTRKAYAEKGETLKESDMEIGKRVVGYLLKYLTSGPVVAMVLEGNEAIFIARKLAGLTESRKAEAGSIRGRYSSDSYDLGDTKRRAVRNIVHASDREGAEREIKVWFRESEIQKYKRADEDMMY